MLDVQLAVQLILRAGRSDFHQHDFKSYEEYEEAIRYLESLQIEGIIEIRDRIRESHSGEHRWAVFVVGLTEAGKRWLPHQT